VFREQFEAAQKETFGVNVKAAEFARLDSDVKRSQKLVEMLEDRINELTMTQSGGPLSIKVVESATPVRQPSFPSKKRTVALGLMLGLMLGSALALVREQTDQRLRSAEDVASVLGIPVLGVVPYMGTGHSVATRGRKMHLDPLSDVAEAVRTIRTAVHFGVPGAAPRTLLVTSAAPGDGKSTIASNLAIAVAQAGRRTLLLDADFRRPSVDEIFELKGALGLSHVLAGTQSVDSALQPTDVENLHVLPCGPVPANPAELLNSTAFGKLLEELSGRYDFVVLDSPPVLPVTDARIVAAYCDVTLLVLRAGKSSRRQAEQAHSALLSVGARVLGGVMNGAAVRRGNDGYYAPYGYYDPEAGLRSPGAGMGRQPKLTNLALVSPPSRWLTNGEKDQSAGRSGDVEDVRSAQNGGDRLQ
jgi:capsular exopolysaccharide synthesis family protein